ncbi:alpha/beta fold hydrolase [uncultured Massilia sp.]|uniref:alpha/beta fold hydrolase n=1 Tax=uncultured Massilia sp. TaxID=169973 RepID=UPI0025CE09BF|nr:alpha/beta hydrolase [uncultured Massilia sp.]
MNVRRITTALLCAAAIGAAGAAVAAPAADAPAPNRYAAAIAPAERFEIDGVLVERHGSRGRPLILVPGLASGSWVWQDTIRAFAADHVLYVLTLPGFDGRPPAGPAPFAGARAAIEKLVDQRRLDKPVLVGHSLGGILGFALAEERPQALGGLVSIDGLPVFPGTEDSTPQQREQQAAALRARLAGVRPEHFAQQQQGYMRTIGVLDMDKADALAQLTARSDPASVGRYTAEVLALDLRPGLKDIAVPVLVLAPYFDLDSQQQNVSQLAKTEYYSALVEGVPNVRVAAIAPARHFAMFDQPEQVNAAIRAFLGGL